MKNKHIVILIMVSVLTSCGAYRKYQPVSDVPSGLYGLDYASSADTASIASVGWREFFRDSCLQALIDSTLARNSDLSVASLRYEQARATLGAARLAYLPSLSLGADGNVTKYDGLTSKTYNIGVNASWEIDIFGRLTAARYGAEASAVSAHEQVQAVSAQLIATVATSYYSLLMLDRQLEIAYATLENWRRTELVLERLKAAGQANEVGVLQARANRMGLQADIATMENNRQDIEHSICAVMAITPKAIDRTSLDRTSFPDSFGIGLPVQLLANRPDIRMAEMEVARTHYALGEARTSFYPSLTLSGTLGFTNNGGVIVNPGQWLMNAVGSLTQPIFNRGQIRSKYKIADAERRIALAKFQQALIDAGVEVNGAIRDIADARRRMALAKEQIALLGESVSKTELMMRYSPTNYLEVLTAQQSLLSAQQSEIQSRYDEISAVITLFHALGGK